MKILFLTHTFNSLAQRLYLELSAIGHEISVEFDISDAVTIEAVALYRPELIIAPLLKRAIPEAIYRNHVCLVVHPGIRGDRGPSALDWAILHDRQEWGVTVLQATEQMDAGPVWASANFAMRAASKSSLYRNEVIQAATCAVLEAVTKFASGSFVPEPQDPATVCVRPAMRQQDRAIDWHNDSTSVVLRKIRSADGFPGVLDATLDCYLYDAHPETVLKGAAGEIIGCNQGMICRATVDGALWIGHLKRPGGIKLPATQVWSTAGLPQYPDQDIRYTRQGQIGYLHFDFYNGAMSTTQCERLLEAYQQATTRDTLVIVLAGGTDYWSNGIHLNLIEAADSPADESWCNINAMNDLVQAILVTETQLVIAALQGNAGAGGVFLALAADRVVARQGVVLNPHYKAMGNLYGSEYWTYLLPRRVGPLRAREITENRLPLAATQAKQLGLIDDCLGASPAEFLRGIADLAETIAAQAPLLLALKQAQRNQDELKKTLASYRAEELCCMKRNFYGFDPSYHVARYNFVYKVPHSRTPRHLALHRNTGGNSACPIYRVGSR